MGWGTARVVGGAIGAIYRLAGKHTLAALWLVRRGASYFLNLIVEFCVLTAQFDSTPQ